MSTKKRLLPFAVLGASLAVAVLLAFGAGQRSTQTALADTGTGASHFEVDADPTNGGGPCNTIDTAVSHSLSSSFTVAICLGDSDVVPVATGANGKANGITGTLAYPAGLRAPNVVGNGTEDLDANPNFDQADTDLAAGTADPGPDGNWDCNQLNLPASAPRGNSDWPASYPTPGGTGIGPASVSCVTSDTTDNNIGTPTARIALVTLTCLTTGDKVVTASGEVTNGDGADLLLDGVGHEATVTCTPAGDLALTKSCPTAVLAGDTVDCTLTITNNGPSAVPNVMVLDNLPDDKVYNDAASSATFCGLIDEPTLGLPAVLNIISCGFIGIGTNLPISMAPGDVVVLHVVYDVPLSAAGKPETDIALAFGTSVFGIPVSMFPDPNFDPVIFYLAANPPCNAQLDPILCAGLALVDAYGTSPTAYLLCSPFSPISPTCNNVKRATVNVTPADLTITKVADQLSATQGDSVTWTITVTNAPGASPATGVSITDTVGSNLSITNAATVPAAIDCPPGLPLGGSVMCTLSGPIAPGDSVTMTVTTTVTDFVGTQCVNNASVTFADPITVNAEPATMTCNSPTVKMDKDADLTTTEIDNTANLWLCNTPDVAGTEPHPPVPAAPDNCEFYNGTGISNNGAGHLVVFERLANNTDPQGAGAFEFQLKYDHKIFVITIQHGTDLNNDGDCADGGETSDGIVVGDTSPTDCFLYTTDRIPNAVGGVGGCEMTIVTENYTLFGCVSKDDPALPGIQTGPSDGVVATIHIDPQADLAFRLTPGQKNGVLRTILDENCEVADIFGDPLSSGNVDALGRQILLPGIVIGGVIEECGDLTVTTRILEGDLNLDCEVDLTDDQRIAFRYGSMFGNLLYDPWYDLEPSLKDFDVDIKDLQKVFGRNGSTCDAPIPAQNAQAPGGGSNSPDPGPLP